MGVELDQKANCCIANSGHRSINNPPSRKNHDKNITKQVGNIHGKRMLRKII